MNLGPIDGFAAGAIGEPGQRTFLIRLTLDDASYWVLLEKGQVQSMAERCLDLLRTNYPLPPAMDAHDLGVPDEVLFRIGQIAVGYGDGTYTFLLAPTDPETASIEFTATPAQVLTMSNQALESVGRGRKPCPRCGLPMDGESCVACPKENGHRRR